MMHPMSHKLSEDEIKARIKVVCICKGIRQSKICDAILKGNKATGSGSGGCSGTRCSPVICRLIELKGVPLKEFVIPEEDEEF
jgi:bacterioferritin-associated ferredoxin